MKFIDLFAGLGGFNLALSALGHQCVFACEIEPHLQELYEQNFGIRPAGDIRAEGLLASIPAHDILCAGFPCQPFSKAGEQNGLDCPQWGNLIDYVLSILALHKPTYLILENVPNLARHGGGFEISDGLKSYRTASLILATGTRPKEIGIANETSLTGNFLFPFCSNVGHRFIGRDVIVIGGRNAGAATALYLNRLGCRVLIVERDPQLNASEKYIELLNDQAIPRMTSTRVESVECEAEVVRVRLHTDKHIEELRAAALFNCTGFIPNNQLMLQLDLQVGQSGYVVVDEHMATSEPGVYAAGDVTGGVKQIPVAVAQGAIAEYNVNKLLKQQ